MAYTEKYYAEFVDSPNKGLGVDPIDYRISFLFKDFAGESKELTVYEASPIIISKTTNDESRFAFWHPLKAQIKLRAESFYESREFYVRSDRDVQVILYSDPTRSGNYSQIDFAGWLMPVEFSEAYKKKPYPIDVVAACGLATLKDRPIVDADGKRLQGYVSLSTVIRAALVNTNLGLPLITGVNIYEQADLKSFEIENGNVNPAKDPLYTNQIVAEALVNEKNETLSCYEALKKVLEPFGCRIGQANGAWFVIRADEAGGGWDVWNNASKKQIRLRAYTGQDITSPPDASSDQSVNLGVDIYPDQQVRVLNDNPAIRLLGIEPGVLVKQDFGRYLNWLKNGDWGEVDNTGLPVSWVRNNISAADSFRAGTGTEDDPYAMVLYGYGDEKANADTPSIRYRAEFTEGSPQFTQSYARVLRGDFELHLLRASKIVVLAYRLEENGFFRLHILQKTGEWKAAPSRKEMLGLLTYHSNEAGTVSYTGKASFTLEMEPLDRVRYLEVWVCIGEALDKPGGGANPGTPTDRPYLKQYQLTLETKQDGVDLNGAQVLITNSKRKIETTAELTLGDVYFPLPYDRTGPLFRIDSHEPTVAWDRTDKAGADAVGQGLPYWLAASMARQYMQPADVVEARLIGRLPFGIHTIFRFLDIGGIPADEPALQATALNVEFKKEIVNVVYPGAYLPWIKVGMTVRIVSSGNNSGDYTVTSHSGLIKNPWFFLVDRTVTNEKVTGVTIADASTITDTTFSPYNFQVTNRYEWDVRACDVDTASVRIMADDVEKLPTPKGFWADSNGNLIPLNPDDSDRPVNPALPSFTSKKDKFLQDLMGAGFTPKLGAIVSTPGYVPISGKSKLGADVLINGIKVGSVSAILRKEIKLFNV